MMAAVLLEQQRCTRSGELSSLLF